MSAEAWRPFRRTDDGTYLVTLEHEDREVLKLLPIQLRDAVSADPKGEGFKRLFPPAYADDDLAEMEYRELVGPELDDNRAQALGVLSSTADATELSEQEMDSWLKALNDIRLWLGTVLDVGDELDDDELDDPPHLLYHALTYLQGSVIEALTEGMG